MRRTITLSLVLTFAATLAIAQDKKPLSPAAVAEGEQVRINYNAPSKRGRVIFGSGANALVPYGKVWRTGANAATTLETQVPLTIGDLKVPAGKYTLFTIPEKDSWTLIVNKQTGQWGTNHDAAQDLGRVKMKVRKVNPPVETFTINLKKDLAFTWDDVQASVPVTRK